MVVTKTYKKIKCTNSFYIDVMKSNNMIEKYYGRVWRTMKIDIG